MLQFAPLQLSRCDDHDIRDHRSSVIRSCDHDHCMQRKLHMGALNSDNQQSPCILTSYISLVHYITHIIDAMKYSIGRFISLGPKLKHVELNCRCISESFKIACTYESQHHAIWLHCDVAYICPDHWLPRQGCKTIFWQSMRAPGSLLIL
jgi:hypothetical protein